jgi:glycosyltransferase involved in cell wall biosynthesis
MLAVIETHPIQYHAPVYRAVEKQFGIPVCVVYGSNFSVVGYHDAEFAATFAWDTDLLSGYTSVFLSSQRELGKALHALAPRAVLLVGYSPRFHQVAWFEAYLSRKPLLLRAETTDHAIQRSSLKGWLRDQVLRRLYTHCQRLLYVGQRSSQHFRRLGCPAEKLVFSPYCVDTTPFELGEPARAHLRSMTRRTLRIDPDHRLLLLSGKLVHRKRPDLLMRAIKQLPDALRERIHVLALGSGEQQPALERLAQETPQVAMTCLGFQNQSRLSAYYHAADLLVLPSESGETWGLVVNEALHHGLPCVVSDAVGSAPDLVRPGVTGEVFESGSIPALASALERAWPLIGQTPVRDSCRAMVDGYTVERAAEGIANAYEAVTHAA